MLLVSLLLFIMLSFFVFVHLIVLVVLLCFFRSVFVRFSLLFLLVGIDVGACLLTAETNASIVTRHRREGRETPPPIQ